MRSDLAFRYRCGVATAAFSLLMSVASLAADNAAMPAREQRDDALRSFLDAGFDKEVALSPQTEAELGIARDQDRLDDKSNAARLRFVELLEAQRDEMRRRFPASALGPEGQLNASLFEAKVERARTAYAWRNHGPFSIDGGAGESATFLVSRHQIGSVADAENYIARLRDIERVLDQLAERLDSQRKLGITPTARQIDRLIRPLQPYTAGAPFEQGPDGVLLADFKSKIAALKLPAQQQADLTARATAALLTEARRGRDRFSAAVHAMAARSRSSDGVWSLPNGDAYYAAALRHWNTTDMTADEIHQLGLSEVERIKGEMNKVLRQVGFNGSLSSFFEMIRTDPRFHYSNDDAGRAQYLSDARRDLDAALAASPRFFRTMPKATIEVRAVEKWRETAPTAYYDPVAHDGTRPGVLYINLVDLTQAQKVQVAAIVHHEGVPGHHFQIALAQERTDLPKFRRFEIGYGAYIEGWALYAEHLADEMGLYDDPYSRFGMLSLEIWRACRLVVDTGIHAKRWTRDQAIAYLDANSSMSHLDIEKEVDRYIALPGQATAYTIGQVRILNLRAHAEQALGARFDIRDFHNAVLRNGALPLNLLQAQVKDWVADQKQ